MADPILSLLNPEETRQLAGLIELTLNHFDVCHSDCEEGYFKSLRLIGDCYHLVLLKTHESGTFYRAAPVKRDAPEIVHMIQTIAYKSRLMDYPWFYPHFLVAVKYILSDRFGYLSQDFRLAHQFLEKISRFDLGRPF